MLKILDFIKIYRDKFSYQIKNFLHPKYSNEIFYEYDKRGVRPIVRYSEANGGWTIECYRRKTKEESGGDWDWKMIRIGHIQSYLSRREAEIKVIEMAELICEEFGY